MIEWREDGILLSVRKHGETSAIIETFSADHGRHAGVVRGGVGRKIAPILQPGAQLDLTWKARLEDHLGAFSVEPIRSRAAHAMSDPLALAGMSSALALCSFALPERESVPGLYDTTTVLLDLICTTDAWPLAYLRWEIQLLEELGFGLDLYQCAVSGSTDDLIYVSPKSGRAVSAARAGEWKSRLLPLVPCMVGVGDAGDSNIAEGLRTTGYFIEKWIAAALHKPVPEARKRFVERLIRQC